MLRSCVLLAMALMLSSCALAPPEWKMEQAAVVLKVESDRKLNYSEGKSHSLRLVVYQLNSPNAFTQLAEDSDGISKLLESQVFDPSVAAVEDVVVYPGADVTYRLSRAEGARYVAVVAGYPALAKEQSVRIFEIPVYVKFKNIFLLSRKLVPGELSVDLIMGAQQIENHKDKQ